MGIPERFADRPPLTREVLDRIAGLPALFETCGVQLAYLFGSTLTSRAPHDIDLAILAADFDGARARTAEFLGSDRLDVVDLTRAGDALVLNILRSGRLIYRRSVEAENDFEMEALRRIQDLEPWRRRQDEILRRRYPA